MPNKKPSLRNEAISALGWSSALQSSSQVISFILGIILARLLTPEDFGLVAMVLVFTAFSQLLTDFGLSAALIQKKNPTQLEYSSCFWFSAAIGILLTLCMLAFKTNIANFYQRVELEDICVCLSIIFFSNSISSVPKAILTKNLKHKNISFIDLYSNLAGWVVAITLAILDYSYWSLVFQQLTTHVIKSIFLIYKSGYKINLSFSLRSLKGLYSFSMYVFGSQTLRQVALQTDKILIGKFLDSATLGLYTRSYQLMLFPINNISRVISQVMFPTLSKIQNDPHRIGNIYLQTTSCIAFLTFPIMLGTAVVSPYFIEVVFGEKWLAMTLYVQYFCFIGMLTSIASISGSIYMALGKSKLHFKVNLINQPLQIAGLFIGIQYGIKGMMIGYAIAYLLSVSISWTMVFILLDIKFKTFFSNFFSPMFMAITMAAITYTADILYFIQFNSITKLIALTFIGVLSYVILSLIFKPKPFIYLRKLAQEKLIK